MLETLKTVGKYFKLPGTAIDYYKLSQGFINKTYVVQYDIGKKFVFQEVNVSVFKDPIGVMKNIDYVTSYIREECADANTLHYHHTIYGDNYFIYNGKFWRVLKYIKAVALDEAESLEDIKKVAIGFGDFQNKLVHLDPKLLNETIIDFHNTAVRLNNLFETAKQHNTSMPELDWIKSVCDKASKISIMYKDGLLPSRICHNDTKANNVLLDVDTHEPVVVVDLDTIMPGTALNDFADGVRFICSTAKEDEKDLNKVSISIEKFRAFTSGFLSRVGAVWDKIEIENLVLATFSITVELAARFLEDYINGSKYFETLYEGHNLDRTRCQIKLAKSIEENWDKLEQIVQEEYSKVL